jgi:formiminotetrahydrofolate cyclodeaminase
MNVEIGKKEKEFYEKEMKKISQNEAWEKIKNGLKEKTTHYNSAYNEKKEK